MKFTKAATLIVAMALAGCQTASAPQMAATKAGPSVSNEVPYRWTLGNAPQAHKDMVAEFNKVGLKPGEFVWATEAPAAGDTRIVVDLLTQMTYVYRGEKLLGASSMSSAKTGHITPYGNWTILEKRPFYRSKKYDNAPMPFMQRIDDYGIAFHGGANPGYPASHGCIRLPMKFAQKLYGVTKLGTKVIIEG
ncbi:L,D-transpeptidase family protein [Sphingomonas flavescens]|uniref:L,D-transpeptidase family protein n=1 Tax=Sphingomonas flavescens TaxID=3132797 RepID=UPI0028058BC0|nr:L,D-transpeptidase family protein [Sphingomonas limnosediminicola]